MQFFLFFALLIAVALVIFAVQNATIVTVSFFTFHFEGSLAFILVIVFAAGFLSGILMSVPSLLRKGSALREQRRKVKKLEEAVRMNGTLPPQEDDSRPPPR
jgi:uncharacterized integral membrane protein